jgi:hypothetical protein
VARVAAESQRVDPIHRVAVDVGVWLFGQVGKGIDADELSGLRVVVAANSRLVDRRILRSEAEFSRIQAFPAAPELAATTTWWLSRSRFER